MTRPDNPELDAAIAEVSRAFNALTKARSKFNRCKVPAAVESARVDMNKAEREYRKAADVRDRLAELDRARRTQNGDPLGAHWSRNHDGPAVDTAALERKLPAGKAPPTHFAGAPDRPLAPVPVDDPSRTSSGKSGIRYLDAMRDRRDVVADGAKHADRALALEYFQAGIEFGRSKRGDVVLGGERLRRFEEIWNARAPRPAANVCEHGDHPTPAGQRFCSIACQTCECADALDGKDCAEICLIPHPVSITVAIEGLGHDTIDKDAALELLLEAADAYISDKLVGGPKNKQTAIKDLSRAALAHAAAYLQQNTPPATMPVGWNDAIELLLAKARRG